MSKNKTLYKDFTKGIAINLLYEGSYVLYKIIALCVILFIVQFNLLLQVANSLVVHADIPIKLDAVLDSANADYIFLSFLIISAIGTPLYIFLKDIKGSHSFYAIRTLPVPKVCNFLVKYFYCLLSVVAVYLTQLMVFMVLLSGMDGLPFLVRGAWLMSAASYGSMVSVFFPNNIAFISIIAYVFFITTTFFVLAIETAHKVVSKYTFIAWIMLAALIVLIVYFLDELSYTNTDNIASFIFVSVSLFASSILSLVSAYKKF